MFLFFFHPRTLKGVRCQYFLVFLGFLFSKRSDFSFICSLPFVICHFPLFIIGIAHFSMTNSIAISWLYILTTCTSVSNSLSVLANSLKSYMMWLIFFLVVYEVCIHPWIFEVCDYVASSLLQIVIAHLSGIYLSGFSSPLTLFLQLWVPLSCFPLYVL